MNGTRGRRGPADPDRGSNSLELVILTPVVVVLLLLVVAFGRYAYSRQLVEQASAAAARAASLSTTAGQARDRALTAAAGSLGDAGLSCARMHAAVDTGGFRRGAAVTVTLSCTADLSDLTLSGVPGSTTLTAASSSVLDTYAQLDSPGHPGSGREGS